MTETVSGAASQTGTTTAGVEPTIATLSPAQLALEFIVADIVKLHDQATLERLCRVYRQRRGQSARL